MFRPVKNRTRITYTVLLETLNPAQSSASHVNRACIGCGQMVKVKWLPSTCQCTHLRAMSLALWDHTSLPATWHPTEPRSERLLLDWPRWLPGGREGLLASNGRPSKY